MFLRNSLCLLSYMSFLRQVTLYSGHMGDTLPPRRRGHALEGVSRHGRAAPVCRPPARGREDGAAVRRVRDLPQDRLQNLRPLQGLRRRRRSRIAAAGRIARRIGCRRRSKRSIVRLKQEYPGWGAPKIREKLRRRSPAPHLPAISTVHAVLDRHGLVKRRRRRRTGRTGTALSRPAEPNALWCADYKGEFMLGDRRVLLSADHHRLRQSLPAHVRSPGDDRRRYSPLPSSSGPSRNLACPGDPHRQRRARSRRPTRSTA